MDQIVAMQDILAGKYFVPRSHGHRHRGIASDKDGVAPDRVHWFPVDFDHLERIDVNVKRMAAVLRG